MKRQDKKQLQLNQITIDRLDNQPQLPIEQLKAVKGGNGSVTINPNQC